ncbi:MAG: hypothetical protein JWN41_1140 [Thermoleophilia bacterium]|nr:hypothetical protein [Thermoleophilia bacterium]
MSQFAEQDTAIEYARTRWEDGERRVQRIATDSRRRELVERVVENIVSELEKRVGANFTTIELIDEQERAERWCLPVAHEVAPEEPVAWEMDLVQNAAFYRYARRASDYRFDPVTT